MYFVYILKSIKTKRTYIGCSKNKERRLQEHNDGKVRSTKAYRPWEVIYFESIENREAAFKREKEIKSYKNNEKFKSLIG